MKPKSKAQIKREKSQERADKNAEELAGHLYKQAVCANCHCEITKYRLKKAKKEKWLPLCEKCDKFLKEQMEKCLPLLKTVFGGKK